MLAVLLLYAAGMFVAGLVFAARDDEPLWLAVITLAFPLVSLPALWLGGRLVR